VVFTVFVNGLTTNLTTSIANPATSNNGTFALGIQAGAYLAIHVLYADVAQLNNAVFATVQIS